MLSTLPPWLITGLGFVFGLVIGSFLNVVIHRVPRGQSIVSPGSSCPACGERIRSWHNIPVISYLFLGGRCSRCQARISAVYPVVELVTALLFSIIIRARGPNPESFVELWFVSVMLALIFIDARYQLLPDAITYPSIVLILAATIFRSALTSDLDPHLALTASEIGFSPWRTAFAGAAFLLAAVPAFWMLDQLDVALFSKYFEHSEEDESDLAGSEDSHRYRRLIYASSVLGLVLALAWIAAVLVYGSRAPELFQSAFDRMFEATLGAVTGAGILWIMRAAYFYLRGIEGLGLGDVKMMAIIGAFFSWQGAIQVLVLGSILGLILGLALLRSSGRGLQTRLPLGVCLGIAALLLLLLFATGILPG